MLLGDYRSLPGQMLRGRKVWRIQLKRGGGGGRGAVHGGQSDRKRVYEEKEGRKIVQKQECEGVQKRERKEKEVREVKRLTRKVPALTERQQQRDSQKYQDTEYSRAC